MYRSFIEAGGDRRPQNRAVEFALDNGRVVGVRVERPQGRELIRLADGGFQANPKLVAEQELTR